MSASQTPVTDALDKLRDALSPPTTPRAAVPLSLLAFGHLLHHDGSTRTSVEAIQGRRINCSRNRWNATTPKASASLFAPRR